MGTAIPLEDAKLCANCDHIHKGEACPVCCSGHFLPLYEVIGSKFEKRV